MKLCLFTVVIGITSCAHNSSNLLTLEQLVDTGPCSGEECAREASEAQRLLTECKIDHRNCSQEETLVFDTEFRLYAAKAKEQKDTCFKDNNSKVCAAISFWAQKELRSRGKLAQTFREQVANDALVFCSHACNTDNEPRCCAYVNGVVNEAISARQSHNRDWRVGICRQQCTDWSVGCLTMAYSQIDKDYCVGETTLCLDSCQ